MRPRHLYLAVILTGGVVIAILLAARRDRPVPRATPATNEAAPTVTLPTDASLAATDQTVRLEFTGSIETVVGIECCVLDAGIAAARHIQGGIAEGLDTLFITGGIEASRFGPDSANPDKTLLEDWLDSQEMSPTFCMGHLR